jgi:hypothetical protein
LPILVASSATRFKLFTPAPIKALSMFGAYEQIVQYRTDARSMARQLHEVVWTLLNSMNSSLASRAMQLVIGIAACYAAATCYHSPFQNQSHHCIVSSNGTCYLITLYIPTCCASILFNEKSSSVKNYALIEDLLIQSRNHKTITRFARIGDFVIKTFRLKSHCRMVPGNKMVQIFIKYSASS